MTAIQLLAAGVVAPQPAVADSASIPPAVSRWTRYWETRPPSAYKLSPALDAGLLLLSVPTWGVRGLESQFAGPSCGQPGNLCDRETVSPFDRAFIYANEAAKPAADAIFWGTVPVLYAVMFLDYGPRQWRGYLTDMTIAFESYTVSAALTWIVRVSTRRPRPFLYVEGAYEGSRESSNSTHSFWSGHVAYMAAFTVSLAYLTTRRHGWRSPWTWILWTAAVGVGTSSAVLAVVTGKHFLSDALVGLGTGAGIGLLVPLAHPRSSKAAVTVTPVAGKDMVGLTLSGSL